MLPRGARRPAGPLSTVRPGRGVLGNALALIPRVVLPFGKESPLGDDRLFPKRDHLQVLGVVAGRAVGGGVVLLPQRPPRHRLAGAASGSCGPVWMRPSAAVSESLVVPGLVDRWAQRNFGMSDRSDTEIAHEMLKIVRRSIERKER